MFIKIRMQKLRDRFIRSLKLAYFLIRQANIYLCCILYVFYFCNLLLFLFIVFLLGYLLQWIFIIFLLIFNNVILVEHSIFFKEYFYIFF